MTNLIKDMYNVKNALAGYYPVQSFGAKGDESTDDTTAIQLAIDTCSADGGGVVYFAPGGYKITTALTLPSGVNLVGSGQTNDGGWKSELRGLNCPGAMIEHHGTSNAVRVKDAGIFDLRLNLQGASNQAARTTGAARGVSLKNAGRFQMQNVAMSGGQGAHLWIEEQVQDSYFTNVRFYSPQIFTDSAEAVIDISAPAEIAAANALTFRDITIENAVGPIIRSDGSATNDQFWQLFDGIKLENAAAATDAQWDWIDITACNHLILRNIHAAPVLHASTNFYDYSVVKLTDCDKVVIDDLNIQHQGSSTHDHQAITLDTCSAINIHNVYESGFTSPDPYRELVRIITSATHNLGTGIATGDLWQNVTSGGGWKNDPTGQTASGNWYV